MLFSSLFSFILREKYRVYSLTKLQCCIFKPIKICISANTLGKQAKHNACESTYHFGWKIAEIHFAKCSEWFAIGWNLHVVIILVRADAYISLRVFQFNGLTGMTECSHTDVWLDNQLSFFSFYNQIIMIQRCCISRDSCLRAFCQMWCVNERGGAET